MTNGAHVYNAGELVEIIPAPVVTNPAPVHEGAMLPGSELSGVEARIVELIQMGEALSMEIARLVRQIETHDLYRQAINPDTGDYYKTMIEYYPNLLKQMRAAGKLHKLSERTVREWVRLRELFVEGLGVPESKMLAMGTSHFSELAEAIDYDRTTKEVRETPRDGKIGKAEALEIIDQIEAEGWRVQDTRQALNETRGVASRGVQLYWRKVQGESGDPPRYALVDVVIWDDDAAERPREGVSENLARWLTGKLSATHNLPNS